MSIKKIILITVLFVAKISFSQDVNYIDNKGNIIVGKKYDSTANRDVINLKLDSLTKSNDTVYQWKNNVRAFAFKDSSGASGGISGLTTNYLTKATSSTTIGNSQLFDNGTNVGIGTTTPQLTSILDILSTTKGVLIPRLTTTQQNTISSPANGLTIYNTDSSDFVVYKSSAWRVIGGDASHYIGTTLIPKNRASLAQTLTGINGLTSASNMDINSGNDLSMGAENNINISTLYTTTIGDVPNDIFIRVNGSTSTSKVDIGGAINSNHYFNGFAKFDGSGDVSTVTSSTLGESFLTATNPSAIRFFRSNASNSIVLEDAATFRTSIGAGTGNGTVTAIGVTTSNGVSGTSSGGSTPNLTISLGAITPTSTNGVSAATMAFNDATSSIQSQLNVKQATLLSGTNIKTVNGNSLLGSGDVTISGSGLTFAKVAELMIIKF